MKKVAEARSNASGTTLDESAPLGVLVAAYADHEGAEAARYILLRAWIEALSLGGGDVEHRAEVYGVACIGREYLGALQSTTTAETFPATMALFGYVEQIANHETWPESAEARAVREVISGRLDAAVRAIEGAPTSTTDMLDMVRDNVADALRAAVKREERREEQRERDSDPRGALALKIGETLLAMQAKHRDDADWRLALLTQWMRSLPASDIAGQDRAGLYGLLGLAIDTLDDTEGELVCKRLIANAAENREALDLAREDGDCAAILEVLKVDVLDAVRAFITAPSTNLAMIECVDDCLADNFERGVPGVRQR